MVAARATRCCHKDEPQRGRGVGLDPERLRIIGRAPNLPDLIRAQETVTRRDSAAGGGQIGKKG
jgi:hypothetical protein